MVAQSIGRDWPGAAVNQAGGWPHWPKKRRHVASRVWIDSTFPTRRIWAQRPFLVHVVVVVVPSAYICVYGRRHRVRRVSLASAQAGAGACPPVDGRIMRSRFRVVCYASSASCSHGNRHCELGGGKATNRCQSCSRRGRSWWRRHFFFFFRLLITLPGISCTWICLRHLFRFLRCSGRCRVRKSSSIFSSVSLSCDATSLIHHHSPEYKFSYSNLSCASVHLSTTPATQTLSSISLRTSL